jgi:hypothetical protein
MYTLTCHAGHPTNCPESDLLDLIEDDRCPTCDASFASCEPEDITIGCPCGYTESLRIDEVNGRMEVGCPNADGDIEAPANIRFHRLAVDGSDEKTFYDYEWYVQGPGHKVLMKKDMADYWDYLVHFTDERGLVEILASHRLLPAPAGYYYKNRRLKHASEAICLTEAPLEFADRFFEAYGPIGFVFTKSSLQALGALPVMSLSKTKIREQEAHGGFAPSLLPFVQLIRTKSIGGDGPRYDWLSDREWRLPAAINLLKTAPVGMVFKDPPDHRKQGDEIWRKKLEAAFTFGEVRLE